jgi:DNA-binding NarL/FixJ family response regulator
VVVFVRSAAVELARAAVRAGARGFLHAGMPPEQIARAVSVVVEGKLALPRELLKGLLAEGRGPGASVLGPRQREVLGLVAEGLSNAEIARRLYLAESTVKQHLRKTYRILGVKNRREAAVALLRGGVSRR